MKIVTGRGEKEHVSAKEHRRLYEGIVGSNDRILPCGEKMVPELVSNNLLRIRSGEMIHHGNVSSVENYDDVELTNGTQGMKRIDLVVNRYTRNAETEIEANEWIVLIGTPAESDPAIPAYTEGDLRNGDLVDDCPVFEVHYDGLNVAEVVRLLAVVKTIEELEAENTDLISKIDSSAGSIIGGHGTEEKIGFYIDGNGMKNTLYSKRIQTSGSPVTLPSGCNIVAVDAWMQHNTSENKYPFPYIDTVSWRVTQVSNFQGNILNWTQGGVDWSNHTGVFVLYYTK